VAGFRFQLDHHLAQGLFKGFNREFAFVAVQNLNEAGHVRPFEMVRQIDVHAERGDGVLSAAGFVQHLHRMPNRFDADLVDGDVARVSVVLDIGDRLIFRAGGEGFTYCFAGAHGEFPNSVVCRSISRR
jgi:hypothetical protein